MRRLSRATACLAAAAICAPAVAGESPVRAAARLTISSRTRALVVSPHPDDAVLGAAGVIARIVARRGSVQIVEMTSGDGFPKGVAAVRHATRAPLTPESYRWYGSLREREVSRAMQALGVTRSRVRLLGFPDEGLCDLAADRAAATVFSSPYTHRDSPPPTERIDAGAKYRAADVKTELEELLLAFRPTLVVLPGDSDLHPDHCATHMLAHDAAAAAESRGLRPPTFAHYVIHRAAGSGDAARATTLTLTAAERSAKTRAIEAYRSQTAVMADFMRSFERPDETFVIGDRETPAPCWCSGRNIAPPSRAQ
ncbi:MAG TPA: PIG-L family deacetylase [Vicinamibacterales bacterium]